MVVELSVNDSAKKFTITVELNRNLSQLIFECLAPTKTTQSKKRSANGFQLKPYMFVFGLILVAFTFYIVFRLHISHRRLIPISVIALIAGVMYEGRKLADNWKVIGLKALGAFVFSFFAFLPGKNESNYDFENHIELWPYTFIGLFLLISIVVHGDKVVSKLTEGITLLQSIAVIYWVVDYGFVDNANLFVKSLMIIGLLFSCIPFSMPSAPRSCLPQAD